ncbi:MAG: ParA family protein [bacterium]
MVIVIMNQKGGVGKTTTAVNLAVSLKRNYERVLLVDMDPQANAGTHLGIRAGVDNSIGSVLSGAKKISEIIKNAEGIDVAPSNIGLAGIELQIVNEVGREMLLKEILKDIDYEIVIIDCPPSLGLLSINALTAADRVIVPVLTDYFAREGLSDFLRTVQKVKGKLNNKLEILGYLATNYDNTAISKDALESLQSHFEGQVFKTVIRINTHLKEAPGAGKSIFAYKKCRGYEDYEKLGEEVYEKIK